MLQVREYREELLFHPVVGSGPIPTACDSDGVYPYESFCETSRRPILREHHFVSIENDHLRAVICPDLGGKVWSLRIKPSGREVLFTAPVVRPVRILPRHAFIGGGIEVSFPISHTPVLLEQVLCQIRQIADRIYVWCGERELRFGLQWTVEYSLGLNDEWLTQRTVFHNPTADARAWMSWSNAGIPAAPDTEFHFPNGRVLSHGREMKVIDWAAEGPRRQVDIRSMTGYFWQQVEGSAFGAYTPSRQCGLYHIADPGMVPGIKLWSDGVGADEKWVSQYTLGGEQCLEIQAGPLVDQSMKDQLRPGETRHHVEYWFPSEKPLDINALTLPAVELASLAEVPLFGWARPWEIEPWECMREVAPSENLWPPSALEGLDEAFEKTVSQAAGKARETWLFYWGAWLAGRGDDTRAISTLERAQDDRARALCGRLHRRRGDAVRAAACFRGIASAAFALHPQVVCERDLALSLLGPETMAERGEWLEKIRALTDEWVRERRAAWLADQGKYQEAGMVLEETDFQLVHQRYHRTALWQNIQRHLGRPDHPVPDWLGEDGLCQFGAYREFND